MSHHYYCETAAPKQRQDRNPRNTSTRERVSSQERESQRMLEINLRLFLETGRKTF